MRAGDQPQQSPSAERAPRADPGSAQACDTPRPPLVAIDASVSDAILRSNWKLRNRAMDSVAGFVVAPGLALCLGEAVACLRLELLPLLGRPRERDG